MFATFIAQAAGVLSAVAPEMLRSVQSSNAGYSPPLLATGQVCGADQHSCQQPGGYIMHPAVVDAATHSAACMQQIGHGTGAGGTHVPVGLHAFLARSLDGALGKLRQWCHCSVRAAKGNPIASFALPGPPAGKACVLGLQTKRTAFSGGVSENHATSGLVQTREAASHAWQAHDQDYDLQMQVLTVVNKVLGAKVSPDQPLMDAGLDSLGEKPCSLHWPDVLVFVPQPVMFGYCRCYGASDVLGHDIRS